MDVTNSVQEESARFRFEIIGSLLASPPSARGELRSKLEELAAKKWRVPKSGNWVSFSVPTLERWYYRAKGNDQDPMGSLRRKVSSGGGYGQGMCERLRDLVRTQYLAHKNWTYKLHFDNLKVLATQEHLMCPSYSTIKRYMKSCGYDRRKQLKSTDKTGLHEAEQRFATKEVRSFEVEHVGGLWHLDFHHGSHKIVTADGRLVKPMALAILDDHSRLCCHAQWYLSETAEDLVHGLSQAILKRGLPRALMSDNGAAMIAEETTSGLARLGIQHDTTLPYSPYQNGKQERFWGQLEGRLMAMLEGVEDLTLKILNDATCAWIEMEYNRIEHREIGTRPLDRFLNAPSVMRAAPGMADIKRAFRCEVTRRQRRTDGTISLESRRFEIDSRFRHLDAITVRYSRWDLSFVHMIDPKTGALLDQIYPLDKHANASGVRMHRDNPMTTGEAQRSTGMAPLLKKLMADYAADGLLPAYLPTDVGGDS